MKDIKIIELMDLFDDEEVTTADKIDRPQEALDREAIDDFNKRNPRAGGGMLVQPSADGSRPGYAKMTEKGVSTPEGGRPIPDHIIMADDRLALEKLQKKVDKLNRVNKLDDKGIKFKVVKTQAGNYAPQLNYLSKEYRDTLKREKSRGPLNKLIEELNQFKKTDLFKNYSKAASYKAGGVKSAKKQLENIGSKKPQVFDYLLNNQNATIEQIAKDLKLKESVVKKNLQGLYTDIYKRYGDQGAVYLKEFDNGQLNSVHNTIKNTKVRLKDRVKQLVIDAYKGDKNLKPLLEKIDKFYEVQAKVKKTKYGKFFAGNLDHIVPLNFIRELDQGTDPMELIRIKPLPEFLNQRAFKAQFDKVLGAAYRTNNKKALEAIVTLQSYLPKEFGGITPDGKIIDYGAKPFTLKTSLSTTDFPEIYKRVFEFINNPDLQDTFDEVKVSFKSLKAQEKNILNQIQGYSKLPECMLNLAGGGRIGFALSDKCIRDGLNQQKIEAQKGNKKAARQLVETAEAATKGRLLKNIVGPGAILGELVFEGALIGNKVLGGKPADIAWAESYLSYLDPRKYSGQLDPLKMKREDMTTREIEDADGNIKTIDGPYANILRSGFAAQDQLSAFNEALQDREIAKNRGRTDQYNVAAADAREQGRFADQSADIISSEAFKYASNMAQEYIQGQEGQRMFPYNQLKQSIGRFESGEDRDYRRRKEQEMKNLYTQYSDDEIRQYLKQSLGTDDDKLIDQYLELTGVTERITPAVTRTLSGLDVLRTGAQEQETMQNLMGGAANFAGGGIAKLAGVSSGPPPESGPNSQGLQGLFNRVKKG